MKLIVLLCALVPGLAFSALGQRSYSFKDTERNRAVQTFVWYPSEESSKVKPLTKGPFAPVLAAVDAAVYKQPKQFPVALLSHGSGGTADKLFWLAEYLVQQGVIVIAVNHAGNMTGDNSARGLLAVWLRGQDLSFALNQVAALNEFSGRLDLAKVAAVGHSAGGTTALLLAGARLSKDSFVSPVPNCKGTKDPYFAALCSALETIDIKSFEREAVNKDYSDKRVAAAVAYDPGFARSFSNETLVSVKDKVKVFIADKILSPQDEIYSRKFAEILGPKTAEVVPPSFHMNFFQKCIPGVAKDDNELIVLCAGDDLKTKIQDEVKRKTMEFFESKWK